jgi:NAD(P)-dependent dehydrogenase (short-subunit alcohol dehydrogenase family)
LAQRLAGRGCRLLLHGRDQAKLSQIADEIRQVSDPGAEPPRTLCADLSDLSEVRDLATTIYSVTSRLDVLVNNAGIAYVDDMRELNGAGHELRFAVNFLAPFYLTLRLMPMLQATGSARVVNVASAANQPIDLDDVMLARGYSGARAYAQSKFALIAAGFEMARRFDPRLVSINSLHPGTMMPTKPVRAVFDHFGDEIMTGVHAIENMVANPALNGVSGRYFDRTAEGKASPAAYDRAIQDRLYRIALELTGASSPDTSNPG